MQTNTLGLLKQFGVSFAATALIGLSATNAIAASANINTNLTTGNGTTSAYQSSTTANPGDVVNFKVFLQNTGSATGTNPRITDTLDSHLSYVAGSSVEYTKQGNNDVSIKIPDADIKMQGQTLTWGFTSMDPLPQDSIYLTFQAKVAAASQFSVGQTNLIDQATSSFDGISLATNNVTIAVTNAAQQAPAFADRTEVTDVTKGDARWYGDNQTGSISAGDTVEYRMIVVNTGNAAAQNVLVKAALPAGLTFAGNVKLYDDNNNGTTISGNSIVNGGYTIANLPNGNSNAVTITFEAAASANCSNALDTTNTTVSYNNASVATDYASVLDSCVNGLVITKQVLNPATNQYVDSLSSVTPGEKLTYQIEVLNNGTSTINNPTVRDALPNNESYVSTSLTIDGESMIQSTVSYFFGPQGMILTNLTPGLGKQIKYQVVVGPCAPSTQNIQNTAYVWAQSATQVSATATVTENSCVSSTPTPIPTPTATPTATPCPTVTPTSKPTPSTPPTTTPTPTGTPAPVTSLPTTGPEMALLLPGSLSGIGLFARRQLLNKKALKQAIKKIDIL